MLLALAAYGEPEVPRGYIDRAVDVPVTSEYRDYITLWALQSLRDKGLVVRHRKGQWGLTSTTTPMP